MYENVHMLDIRDEYSHVCKKIKNSKMFEKYCWLCHVSSVTLRFFFLLRWNDLIFIRVNNNIYKNMRPGLANRMFSAMSAKRSSQCYMSFGNNYRKGTKRSL
jgi:hypothetical protein